MKKIKVAIIHNIVSPYRIPVFNALSAVPNIDLTVFFLNHSAHNRKWQSELYLKQLQCKYVLLPSISVSIPFGGEIEYNINATLHRDVLSKKFDVIVCSGWVDFACQVIPFLKRMYKYKFILWAGSTKNEPSFQRKLFKPLVARIVSQSDAIITYGTKSSEYIRTFFSKNKTIYASLNSVDNDHFIKLSNLSRNEKKLLKEYYSIPPQNKVVLFVGQFIERKNVETLLYAMKLLKRNDTTLVLLGHGPLKEKYLHMANALGISLKIIDHMELDKIPGIYSLATVFVLPSFEEVWGLVVNEAMASKVPVICSKIAGCVPDLIKHGHNGYVFNPNSARELATYLQSITSDKKHRTFLAKNALHTIATVSPEAAASVFAKSIIETTDSFRDKI